MAKKLALGGIRVVDLTRAWAGPHCAALLGHLGAEVIKVEPPGGDHLMRGRQGGNTYVRTGAYYQVNLDKLGVCLNLRHPRGLELLKSLVHVSDVVLDNFSAHVMDDLGLGYSVLKTVKPDIIMCSMPGYGATGPWSDLRGYGVCLEPLMGLFSLTGYQGDVPVRSGVDHLDPLTGTHAASAILTALLHREVSGEGQFIDVSHVESAVATIGESIMDYTMNRRSRTRMGNRDYFMAPHGCYRCRGEDKWVTIAVGSDEEWQRLCEAQGNPEWARDEKFSNALSRWQNQDELDKKIEEWTSQRDHYEVMHFLQKAGVAAGAVLNTEELAHDPHLKERSFFQELDHPEAGRHTYIGVPWKMSRTWDRVRLAAPVFAEHSNYVFGELLGLSREDIALAVREGVILLSPQ